MSESDDENEPMTVKLRAHQSEREFEISYKAAKVSELVRELASTSPDNGNDAIEISRVDEATLEKVVEFLVHHATEKLHEIEPPLNEHTLEGIVDQEWYRNFIQEQERPMLFSLLNAANYMGIKPLLDLACLLLTFELMGKSAEEIREILNLPELSPEEESNARNAHPWVFDGQDP